MDTSELKRIDEVPLREVWEHEEQDFTPWLLENIDQLASLIGIEIDDANRETAVGDYTATLSEQNRRRAIPLSSKTSSDQLIMTISVSY
ncbi:hypothetical protein [Natronobacterium gregoryi]|uniref:Uncharacterized protein n=2 Tax=Natronobacterium gregoryi TaxID=44930 RepID=L0AIZ5_NATGS|nr:hypothetical protein [Natronobacterium gregoryi]AFZ73771.1 hypothetical protein Natgr_2622 [Natronobacterium gregoryi SP2]ELY65666.1 hypothetical protein C490_13665 [Natronobacterium gregoryi SP2]SFJ65766.1 hypothetical protein SAMN05443661_1538 [Natronobacterium gregoryi]